MGSFKNKAWQNWVGWSTAAIMIGLTGAYIYTGLVG
jgi:Mn2+/Fe2+ NRAMP family transporter